MYTYSVAQTEEEKDCTLKLVNKMYQKSGYFPEGKEDSEFSPYIKTDHTTVFKAAFNDEIFATISVVRDSERGLPMDFIYKDELKTFRENNKKLAEVSQFAVDHDYLKEHDPNFSVTKRLSISQKLFSLVLDHALRSDLDYLCIATTPRHGLMYKSLGFMHIGGPKFYPLVNVESVAHSLDLKRHSSLKGFNYLQRAFVKL